MSVGTGFNDDDDLEEQLRQCEALQRRLAEIDAAIPVILQGEGPVSERYERVFELSRERLQICRVLLGKPLIEPDEPRP